MYQNVRMLFSVPVESSYISSSLHANKWKLATKITLYIINCIC